MKKCIQCGTVQDNKYVYCIDCNAKLGEPLPDEEEAPFDPESFYVSPTETDYFNVSLRDKLTAIGLIIFTILHIILLSLKGEILNQHGTLWISLLAISYSVATAFELLLPELRWELFKLRIRNYVNNPEDLEPSPYLVAFRKYAWVGLIIVIAAFIFLLLDAIITGY